MNLVTIESLEEQKNIMEQLKKYETEPAVYWISLDRKDKKSGWRWKYPGKFLKLWFGVNPINRQTGWGVFNLSGREPSVFEHES